MRTKNTQLPSYSQLGLVLAAAAALVLCLIFGTGQAHARDGEEQVAQTAAVASQTASFVPEEYRYIVEEGNNQTLLVRRSAQLYDLADDSIALSPAQLIYVEANVVQDMGARDLIHPDEMIDVMSSLIADYASMSQDLSQDVLDAWQVYADNADLDIDDISPQNVEVSGGGQVVERETNGDEQEPEFTAEAVEEDQVDDNDWYWWLLATGAGFLLWYALLRVREPASK